MDVTDKLKQRRPMLEFFAGSGLVGYGLSQFFCPVWANDISAEKGAVSKSITTINILIDYEHKI